MMRLVVVELRRLMARRMVLGAVVAALGAVGLMLYATWDSVQPLSDTERAEAERWYQESVADWEAHGDEYIASCLEGEAAEAEALGDDVDWDCEDQEPRLEHFIFTAPPLGEVLPQQLSAVGTVLLLVAFVIGTTLTAAELSTGAMSNWLTFEPRRLRVYVSKVLAPPLATVPIAVALLVIFAAGSWLLHLSQGLADGTTGADWSTAVWTVVRATGLAVLAAFVGAALGFLLRHTAAVLGVVVGYLVVVEVMLGTSLTAIKPWTIYVNVESWLRNGTVYHTYDCTTDATGTMCESVEHALTFGDSATYLLGLVAVVVLTAGLTFRYRDAA